METVLLLFSGGKDSFIAACREIAVGNRVLLISFNNSAVIGEKNILHGVARLQKKYEAEQVSYAGCYNTGAIIQKLNAKWANLPWIELGTNYPHLTNAQMTCLHCQTAMWVSAIAYARAKGISVIATGYKQSDQFCTGFNAYHKQIQGLAHKNGCQVRFPVLDDSEWVNSPGGIERDYEMEQYCFVPSVYEPKCMLGRPVPPMSPEMKKDMEAYFEQNLKQIALDKINKMIPIFRSIELTPVSMKVPDYPLPDE